MSVLALTVTPQYTFRGHCQGEVHSKRHVPLNSMGKMHTFLHDLVLC